MPSYISPLLPSFGPCPYCSANSIHLEFAEIWKGQILFHKFANTGAHLGLHDANVCRGITPLTKKFQTLTYGTFCCPKVPGLENRSSLITEYDASNPQNRQLMEFKCHAFCLKGPWVNFAHGASNQCNPGAPCNPAMGLQSGLSLDVPFWSAGHVLFLFYEHVFAEMLDCIALLHT